MTPETPNPLPSLDADPELFRALGDVNRIELVLRLANAGGALTVSELGTCCGVHLSGVSRHLRILREAGIITAERRGREVLYRLEAATLAATLRSLAEALECCPAGCCSPNPEEFKS